MKNLIILFWITLSVNCFCQDAKILRTDPVYNVTMIGVEDTCACKLPYTTYVAILNQEAEDAPVATVLENTTAYSLTWVFDSGGNFYATGIPSESLVWVIGGDPVNVYSSARTTWNGSLVLIEQVGLSYNFDPIPMNGLVNFPIEIRIY
jgi:hypothetical protein